MPKPPHQGCPPIRPWIEIDGRRRSHAVNLIQNARQWLVDQLADHPEAELYGIDRYDGHDPAEVIFQSIAERERLGLGDDDTIDGEN